MAHKRSTTTSQKRSQPLARDGAPEEAVVDQSAGRFIVDHGDGSFDVLIGPPPESTSYYLPPEEAGPVLDRLERTRVIDSTSLPSIKNHIVIVLRGEDADRHIVTQVIDTSFEPIVTAVDIILELPSMGDMPHDADRQFAEAIVQLRNAGFQVTPRIVREGYSEAFVHNIIYSSPRSVNVIMPSDFGIERKLKSGKG